jgi:hypothetical protein
MNTGVRRAELSWECVCKWVNELSSLTCKGCDRPRPNCEVDLKVCMWVQAHFDELMTDGDIFPSKSPLQGPVDWLIERSK